MRRLLPLLLLLAACGRSAPAGPEPHQIRLVGASAGLLFTSAAAERLTRDHADAIAPLAQADGSDAGIMRFCGGLGSHHPDLALVTRAITPVERARCAANGVARIAEVPLGWSALVVVTRPDTPPLPLTRAALARALAGPARDWRAIDPRLPPLPILIDGPARRLARADGLAGLIAPGVTLRRDGAYREHGASAALVADAVAGAGPDAGPDGGGGAIGLMPYADAVQAGGRLRMLSLDGVAPDPSAIADGRYAARMPLLLLVKTGEARAVPSMPALLDLIADDLAPGGAFERLGLVPLAPAARAAGVARLRAVAAARL